jgi:ankyrin repeat protein
VEPSESTLHHADAWSSTLSAYDKLQDSLRRRVIGARNPYPQPRRRQQPTSLVPLTSQQRHDKQKALGAKYSSDARQPVLLPLVEDETPLNVACALGHLDVVKALDSAGARRNVISSWGMSALHFAAANGNLQVVEYLVSKPDVDKELHAFDMNTALHLACAAGRDQTVKVTIPIPRMLRFLHTTHQVLLAVPENCCLQVLLRSRADKNALNSNGDTPISIAAFFGHDSIVAQLVEHQGSITNSTTANSSALHFVHANEDGYTPLMLAAAAGHIDVVQRLLRIRHKYYNAIDHLHHLSDSGQTALEIAADQGRYDMVYLLVREGANVDSIRHILVKESEHVDAMSSTFGRNYMPVSFPSCHHPGHVPNSTMSALLLMNQRILRASLSFGLSFFGSAPVLNASNPTIPALYEYILSIHFSR